MCEDDLPNLGQTSTQPRLKILYHLRCSLGYALCEDGITILGQTSTQPRLKIHCTLFFQEHFWNVDLDLHLSVTDRCMLQVHILHQGFSTDLSVAVLCAKMIFQTWDKPRFNLDSRYFIIRDVRLSMLCAKRVSRYLHEPRFNLIPKYFIL